MERVFVDTSAWIAYANLRDGEHELVVGPIGEWMGRLVTSNFVFGETVTYFMSSVRHDAAVAIGAWLLEPLHVSLLRVSADDEAAAWALLKERPDKRYSYTDGTSFVIMRRLGLRKAIALDDDFRREGFEVLP